MKWLQRREDVSTIADLAGAGCITWSAFSLNATLGEFVLGALLITVGWVIGK